MAGGKSSFHISNEFNGYGDITYLKGTQRRTYAPLSQDNVRLTRDFSSLVAKMLGGIPLIMNAQTQSGNLMTTAVAGMPMLNKVFVTNDNKAGMYSFNVHVASSTEFTNGAYLQTLTTSNEVPLGSAAIKAKWEEQQNRKWKYINNKGSYVVGDWVEYKSDRYYMDEEGYMVTEWRKIGSKKWYYFKSNINTEGHEQGGQMALGWRLINKLWYYLEPSAGYMLTGWQTVGGKKYYLKKESEASNGNDFGYMLTGWREIGNKWYYFHDQGNMAVSEWIDGEVNGYWVGEDGVWVEGTKKEPMIFEDGEEHSVTGSEVWIQCNAAGATDFYVKTSSSAQIKVYKDKMVFDTILYDKKGTLLKDTYSDCTVNNNNNTYLIHVKADSQITVKCKINTHVDTFSYAKGALWKPNETSAMYFSGIQELMYWYVDSIRVSYLVTLVNDSSFLDFQSALINVGASSALLYLGGLEAKVGKIIAKKIIKYATGAAGIFTAIKAPADFKGAILSDIDEAAGYAGTDSYMMPIYERGVCLKEFTSQGLSFYSVSPWEGPEMEGAKGYTGKWEKNPKLEEE